MAAGESRLGCEKDSHGEDCDENEARDRVIIANHVVFITSPYIIYAASLVVLAIVVVTTRI